MMPEDKRGSGSQVSTTAVEDSKASANAATGRVVQQTVAIATLAWSLTLKAECFPRVIWWIKKDELLERDKLDCIIAAAKSCKASPVVMDGVAHPMELNANNARLLAAKQQLDMHHLSD